MTTSDANPDTSTSNIEHALATRVLEQLCEGVLITDADERIVSTNPAFTRLTGFTEAEVVGRTPAVLRSGLHGDEFFRAMHARLRDSGEWEGEIWNRRKDGHPVLHHMSISAIEDETGSVSHYLALLSEVSPERADERRYRTLFEESPAGMAELDTNGAIRHTNPAFREMAGREADELAGLALADLATESHRPELSRATERLGRGLADRASLEIRVDPGTEPPVWASLTLSLLRGPEGGPDALLAAALDITETRASQQQLQDYKRLLDRLPVGVYRNLPGPEGRFLEANPAMASLFEADSVADLLARPVTDLYADPQQRAVFSRELQEAGALHQRELRLRTLTGRPLWVAVTAQRSATQDGQEVFDGTVEDITARKEAERTLANERRVAEALRRILTELVYAIHTPEALFQRVCSIVVEEGGFRLAWVGRPDAEGRVRPEAWAGEGTGYLRNLVLSTDTGETTGQGPSGTALREDRPVVVQDLDRDPVMGPWRERAEENDLFGVAALPFHRGGAVAGALHVYAPEADFFTDAVVELLRQTTRAMGFALDNHDRQTERNRLIEILESSPDYIAMARYDGQLTYINAGGLALFGYPSNRNGVQGPIPDGLQQAGVFHRPEWAARKVREEGFPEAKAHGHWVAETALYDAEGHEIPVSQIIVAHYGSDGGVEHVSTIVRDISRQKRLEGKLRLLAAAFNAGQAVMIMDPEGRIEQVNRAFSTITGYEAEEVIGRTPRLLRSGYHDTAFFEAMRRSLAQSDEWSGEIWNRRKDGSIYPQWEAISMVRDESGQLEHYVAVFHEITEQKRLEAELEREASYDRLTGAYNRLRFEQFLDHEIQRSDRYGSSLALIMLDVDHFKAVNDRYGHDAGDRILQGITEAVERASRQADLLARWGGEEFMLLLPDTGMEQATRLAERLRASVEDLSFPQVGGVTISLGVSAHQPEESIKTLVKRLDNALYAAKEGGRNTVATRPSLE